MILSLTLVAVALAILALLLYLEAGRYRSVRRLEAERVEDLAGQTMPVNIDAFRNLVDPKEDAFLQANLSGRELRAVQRARARAAMDYVRNAAHNAALLLRLGEAAAQSPDPQIARAGTQLVNSALRLRVYALLTSAQLYMRVALPAAPFSYAKLVDNYQNLSGLAGQVMLMQHPGRASRLSALL